MPGSYFLGVSFQQSLFWNRPKSPRDARKVAPQGTVRPVLAPVQRPNLPPSTTRAPFRKVSLSTRVNKDNQARLRLLVDEEHALAKAVR